MRTVLRIYQNKDGSFGGQKMCRHLSYREMLEMSSEIDHTPLSDKEMDDIKSLMGDETEGQS
jgi:hypothetical protein